MAETPPADGHARESDTSGTKLRRRGLIAGAAALVAAAVATRTAQPVGASQLVGTYGFTDTPDSSHDGVQGYAIDPNAAGVFGRNNTLNGVGVMGVAPSGIGVAAASTNGPALSATTTNGYGLFADSTNSHGVYGSTHKAGFTAIYGTTNSVSGAYAGSFNGAVSTSATDNHAIQGYSSGGYGVVGTSYVAYGNGVLGQVNATGAVAVVGVASGSAVSAGYFAGAVTVAGNFGVTGAKSAVVPHPDGSHRLFYAVEAPESWFEDVGQANLVGGTATVAIDPDFAATVLTANYHVFLTPYGDCKGLAVTDRTASGFTVRELQGGTSSLAFSWKVMAKRKDITGARLAKVELPQAPKPVQPPTLEVAPGQDPQPSFPPIDASTATVVAQPSAPPAPASLPKSGTATATGTATGTATKPPSTTTATSGATATGTAAGTSAAPTSRTAATTGTPTPPGSTPNPIATPRT